MKSKKCLIISLALIISAFLITGCSSSIKPVKPIGTESEKIADGVSPLQTERTAAGTKLTFPVSNDLHDSCYYQLAAYRTYLAKDIRLYRRATGTYPESMAAFVRSGFPLYWPRNVMTGAPVGILVGRDFNFDKSDLGLIKWEKFSDDYAKLSFVDLDYKTHRDSGTETWIERSIEFKWRKWETYRGETIDDIRRAVKEGLSSDDKEKVIDIMGGTVPVNDVLSKDNRITYGMCGQLTDHVCGATQDFYFSEKNFVLPSAFKDLYSDFRNDPGFQNEHNLIILENLANLSKLLKNSSADFKIGFDYSKSAQYSWLKIGNETLIVFCQVLNPDSAYGIDHQYNGIQYNDNGENIDPDFAGFNSMADMSSPMITANNLDQIEIPKEIVVSIEDIPLGD